MVRLVLAGLLVWGSACVTVAVAPRPSGDRVGAVLARVMAAEGDRIGIDSRANVLRKQARASFQAATRALAKRDHAAAARLLDQAEADAELALAIGRRDAWTAQAEQAELALMRARAEAEAAGRGPQGERP